MSKNLAVKSTLTSTKAAFFLLTAFTMHNGYQQEMNSFRKSTEERLSKSILYTGVLCTCCQTQACAGRHQAFQGMCWPWA
jgi:hypothetical protein